LPCAWRSPQLSHVSYGRQADLSPSLSRRSLPRTAHSARHAALTAHAHDATPHTCHTYTTTTTCLATPYSPLGLPMTLPFVSSPSLTFFLLQPFVLSRTVRRLHVPCRTAHISRYEAAAKLTVPRACPTRHTRLPRARLRDGSGKRGKRCTTPLLHRRDNAGSFMAAWMACTQRAGEKTCLGVLVFSYAIFCYILSVGSSVALCFRHRTQHFTPSRRARYRQRAAHAYRCAAVRADVWREPSQT